MKIRTIVSMTIAAAVLAAASGTASARFITEDFVGTGGGFAPDPELIYDFDLVTSGIQGPANTGSDFSGTSFGDSNDVTTPGELGLFPDAVRVTYDISSPEFVSFVQVDGEDQAGGAEVTFIGQDTAGNPLTFPFTSSGVGPFSANTAGQGFGVIEAVEIGGLETRVFEIESEVVPEPATMSVIALGSVAMLRRRKARSTG